MRGEPISDNSQGKILRGTASTYKESMHTPVSSVTRGQIQNIVNPIQGTPIQVPQTKCGKLHPTVSTSRT